MSFRANDTSDHAKGLLRARPRGIEAYDPLYKRPEPSPGLPKVLTLFTSIFDLFASLLLDSASFSPLSTRARPNVQYLCQRWRMLSACLLDKNGRCSASWVQEHMLACIVYLCKTYGRRKIMHIETSHNETIYQKVILSSAHAEHTEIPDFRSRYDET